MAIVVATLSACDGGSEVNVSCSALPCPMPMAVTITLTNATSGGTVKDGVVQFTGPAMGTAPCAGSCGVPGYAGTYNLNISAPGFQAVQRSVTVTASDPAACGCGTTNTVHLDVALVAGA